MPRRAKRPPQEVGNPQYTNRTDLMGGSTQPIRTPTGMPYGENKTLAAAQAAAPLPQAPAAPQPNFQAAVDAAAGMPFPDNHIAAPTQRPQEPVTHGLSVGPGAGPEVLHRPAGAPTIAATLSRLAVATGGDPDLVTLLRHAEIADS